MFLSVLILYILIHVGVHACNTNAPQISLQELHSGCNAANQSRTPDCAAAYNRYCNRIQFSSNITTIGVSREVSGNRIEISCIKADWAGDVSIQELQSYHNLCTLSQSQFRYCLSATHRFCTNKLGVPAGGISAEVGNGFFLVKCFKAVKEEFVNLNVMKDMNSSCNFPELESANCFSAASRWCALFGYSGGITQGVNTTGMVVACYNAEYSGDAYIARNTDFFQAQTKAIQVCNITFDIDNARILDPQQEFLKTKVYNNRGSCIELNSVFLVSKIFVDTSSFSHDRSLTLGVQTEVKTGLPYIVEGKVTLSASVPSSINFQDKSSETVEYISSSAVSVPPGEAIIKQAVVSRANLEVDWNATVVDGLGSIRTVGGKWTAVQTYDFKVIQEDVNQGWAK